MNPVSFGGDPSLKTSLKANPLEARQFQPPASSAGPIDQGFDSFQKFGKGIHRGTLGVECDKSLGGDETQSTGCC